MLDVEEHLESDDAVEGFVARLIDNTHAAAAKHTQDLISGHLGKFIGRERLVRCEGDGFLRRKRLRTGLWRLERVRACGSIGDTARTRGGLG
jgi:hypothetical protein